MKSSSKDKDSFFSILSRSIGRGGLYIGGIGDKNLPAWKVTRVGSFPSFPETEEEDIFENSVVISEAL